MEYHVIWEADVTADSPEEAALEAYRMQTDPVALAPVFDVVDPLGSITRVDVEELVRGRGRNDDLSGS